MTIRVKSGYELTVGKTLQKIAGRINVEARKKNLVLASNKRVVGQGGKES
ncbi:hypothetical protein [Pedobacter yulinensis]|nr:hypothetical protein [Pedobacter yulinensis]